jgi:RHS repeat-associated protein
MNWWAIARQGVLSGFLALALSLVFGSASLAQQPDETLPGFTSGSVFHSSGVDNVNLFSGDPGIVIPLGPAYSLSPGFTWQLKAYNTSKFWHFDTDEACQSNGVSIQHAMIHGYPTLGLGWTLDPGYIGPGLDTGLPQSQYHQPDGGQPRGLEAARLRATTYQTGGNSNCSAFPCTTIEFPDGSTQVFDHAYHRAKATGTPSPDFTDEFNFGDDTVRYGLSKIIDRFNHVVLQVSYDATHVDEFTRFVLYADRSVTITLTWQDTTVGTSAWRTVQSIAFPVIGSQTQTVAFTYDTSHGVHRNSFDTSNGNAQCGNPPTTYVPYLTQIDFKNGSTVLATYESAPCFDTTYCSSTNHFGSVEKLTLPTGGATSYHYSVTHSLCTGLLSDCPDPELAPPPGSMPSVPLAGCPPPVNPSEKFGDFSAAVFQRDELDASGAPLSTTTYTRYDYVPKDTSNCQAPFLQNSIVRQVVVTQNSGDGNTFKTNHLFHVAYFQGDLYDYEDGGREIERRYFAEGVDVSGTPVRTIINCLTTGSTEGPGTCGYRSVRDTDIHHINAYTLQGEVREQRSVTWYGDNPTTSDGGTCSTTPCSESANNVPSIPWDDTAKHYNTTTLTSTLPAIPGWSSRAHTTVWNGQTGTHWLLDIFTSKSVTDGGSGLPSPPSITTNYSFDTSSGYLKSFSITDSIQGTLTDTFSTSPDSFGYPTSRTISGSWTGSGSFTDNWSFAKNGLLTSNRMGISWKSFDVDRDVKTGLIKTSRGANSSLATTYAYDVLGRLTTITPPGREASTTVSYDSTTQTTVTRSGSDGNGTWQRYLYDSLGRLSREIRQMPSAYAVRTHGYDNGDHANFVSEWGSCTSITPPSGDCLTTSPGGTTSSNFDPFGRAQTITRADGSVTTIDYSDGSILFSDSLESVTITINGSPSKTTTRKDALGRIVAVTEDATGVADVTSYTYNVLDKLAGVTQGAQSRTFAYDAFGFLRQEVTPEKGTVGYSAYDALGDVGTETENDNAQIQRTYDAAGRLLTVTAPGQGGAATLYVQNCYDGQNPCVENLPTQTGGTYPLGRLTRRYGSNPLSNPALRIGDAFSFSSPAGRLTAQYTDFDSGLLGSATQSWAYNSLGLVSQHSHYRQSGSAPFTVTTSYSQGLATTEYTDGIPAVTSVTYSPSGALSGYSTGLGIGPSVVTTITPDPSGIPRPHEIKAGSGAFDTGSYGYDGAGNILSMGSDSFTYDARSRLCTASLSGIGSQYYGYDRYGNMITKGSSSTPCASSTSWSSNRVPTATYDTGGHGNLIGYAGTSYAYDGLDRLTGTTSGTSWSYSLDGASERVVKYSNNARTYTLRDEGNRVSTEFGESTTVHQSRDNVLLGSLLVASFANPNVGGNGPIWGFYCSDHLGTPRLITDVSGSQVEARRNWPYGEDIGTPSTAQRLRFASMERDTEDSTYHDHARNHEFNLGRFLNPDRVGGQKTDPQSWNRYGYARNNPLKLLDPNGLLVVGATQYYDAVASTYANSATFRALYDAQNHNPTVIQRLQVGIIKSAFSRANTSPVHSVPMRDANGNLVFDQGKVVGKADVIKTTLPPGAKGPLIGHELQHGVELSTYGDNLKSAPGVRASADGQGLETQPALDLEQQISKELSDSGGKNTLTPEQESDVFGPSQSYDQLPYEQRKTCETDPHCLNRPPPK